ncbi:hypothetical protein I79_007870 [Cricetulus griseus]|uniref:Uncharacterized protein n=1 Tax=Cricetulus griseus TaxID=10029 RepID=G3HBS1_CRIGR|nr:hypothetical protein I79_007870 [Cricetulus griseus]
MTGDGIFISTFGAEVAELAAQRTTWTGRLFLAKDLSYRIWEHHSQDNSMELTSYRSGKTGRRDAVYSGEYDTYRYSLPRSRWV